MLKATGGQQCVARVFFASVASTFPRLPHDFRDTLEIARARLCDSLATIRIGGAARSRSTVRIGGR